MKPITFGSVCSGIEAASVAWNPLGWRAAWLAEIEPFPCAVLAHHYPDVPNLGDMTKIAAMLRAREIPAPDVFCGGTPCQAFSVAGLRRSLDDARGNLSLTFCEIANEIDIRRAADGAVPCVVFWENVPGVLSTKDNAFGCFLAGLAGEDDPLVPAGGKWTNAGCVFGPKRVVAWRVTDAQFFGVAQRRRRVFVVASAREGFDPGAVLFEPDCLHRDSAPRREAREDITHDLAPCLTSSGRGVERTGDTRGQDPVVAVAQGKWPADIACTLNAAFGKKLGLEDQHINGGAPLFVPAVTGAITAGFSNKVGAPEVDAGLIIPAARTVALRGRDGGATAELGDEVATCLRASTEGGDKPHVLAPVSQYQHHCPCGRSFFGQMDAHCPACGGGNSIVEGEPCEVLQPIAFNARQDPDHWIDRTGPLDTDGGTQAVAFSCKDYGADAAVEIAPTMRAIGHAGSHANAGGQLAVCVTGDITHTLKAEGFDASEDGTGRGQPIVAHSVRLANTSGNGWGIQEEVTHTLDTTAGPAVQHGMAVRRLTPRECERLQGFQDDYTLIPVKKAKRRSKMYDYVVIDGQLWQLAADGPRYKALGNSWAVPNVRWIGRRIDGALRALDGSISATEQ